MSVSSNAGAAARGFLRAAGCPLRISAAVGSVGLRNSFGPQLEQIRGYPSQKHQKLIAEAQKRNRARKLMKQDEVKVDFITARKNALKKTSLKSKRYDPGKDLPVEPHDDVYHHDWYREPTYSLEQCVAMHRELLHPSMLNKPGNILMAGLELNMHTKKKTKFLESFEGTLLYPHPFPTKSRLTKILCFCKTGDEATILLEKGAHLAGGASLIKKISAGEVDVSYFEHVLCSVEMVEEVAQLKSILKKRLPVLGRSRTISSDLQELVAKYKASVIFQADRDVYEPDYGFIEVPLAKLDMPYDHIEENLHELFKEVNDHQPKGRPVNSFISQVFLTSAPSPEKFVLDKTPFEKVIKENAPKVVVRGKHSKTIKQEEDADDDEEEEVKVQAEAT